jgi:hypothetical protein
LRCDHNQFEQQRQQVSHGDGLPFAISDLSSVPSIRAKHRPMRGQTSS